METLNSKKILIEFLTKFLIEFLADFFKELLTENSLKILPKNLSLLNYYTSKYTLLIKKFLHIPPRFSDPIAAVNKVIRYESNW